MFYRKTTKYIIRKYYNIHIRVFFKKMYVNEQCFVFISLYDIAEFKYYNVIVVHSLYIIILKM